MMIRVAGWASKQFANHSSCKYFFSTLKEPTLDVASFQEVLAEYAPSMSESLIEKGFYVTPQPFSMLAKESIQTLREQSIELRSRGRFEQSWSEKIDNQGNVTRFDKEGVIACEPDGQDYNDAPDLIVYMSVLLQTLPALLNTCLSQENKEQEDYQLSMSSFNAKLALTLPGGSTYPLHIDNPQGLADNDIRKLTCILYLNPDYQAGDGGELRIHTNEKETIDVNPDGGRMVMFWSDEIPHEVLPTCLDDTSDKKHRYALTLWIPTDNPIEVIHNPRSRFASLGDAIFPSKTRT
jgi:Rps23 Pro-64 3,4-dihydroxylase Tpa1-like proline 4-hydroxylase